MDLLRDFAGRGERRHERNAHQRSVVVGKLEQRGQDFD
jgi:hypothetical protein